LATRLLGAKLNLLSVREVLNARDKELSDGGGLLLRPSGERAVWVLRYTSPAGKRREMGLGACVRHNAKAAGESLALARDLAASQRALLASEPPLDPLVVIRVRDTHQLLKVERSRSIAGERLTDADCASV